MPDKHHNCPICGAKFDGAPDLLDHEATHRRDASSSPDAQADGDDEHRRNKQFTRRHME